MIGKGFGKRFEAPSYEEGVGVDGSLQPLLQKAVFHAKKQKVQEHCALALFIRFVKRNLTVQSSLCLQVPSGYTQEKQSSP